MKQSKEKERRKILFKMLEDRHWRMKYFETIKKIIQAQRWGLSWLRYLRKKN